MTAIATPAAALAAFLSLWAASRQEDATFASAILTRQTEAMAEYEDETGKALYYFNTAPERMLPDAPTANDIEYNSEARRQMSLVQESLRKLRLVLPEEVDPAIGKTLSILYQLKTDFEKAGSIETDIVAGGNKNNPSAGDKEWVIGKFKQDYGYLVDQGTTLYKCIAAPLKHNRNVDGNAFLACQRDPPKLAPEEPQP